MAKQVSGRTFWIGTALVIALVLLFVFWPAFADAMGINKKENGVDEDLLLYKGMTGPEILALQKKLNKLSPNNLLEEDEVFGPLTEAKLYQLTGKYTIRLKDL